MFLCPGACRSHAGVGGWVARNPTRRAQQGMHGWLLTNGGQTQDAVG